MSTVALIGPPGVGKSTMVVKTALKRPIHIIDVDRKVRTMATFRPYIEKGEVTYKEIGETIQEDGLKQRLVSLVKDEKIARPPRGWTSIANYVGELESDPQAKAAGTILWDSYTLTAQHLRAHIQYLKGKSKFAWDDWSTWYSMWTEVTTIMCDYALATEKDFMITIHERVNEKPGDRTKGVQVTEHISPQGVPTHTKTYLGTQDILIAGSVSGQFGLEFAAHFTDVYRLAIDMIDDKPKWVCRVLPDGLRDLRCSYEVYGQAEWEPDFRQIWNAVPPKAKPVEVKK